MKNTKLFLAIFAVAALLGTLGVAFAQRGQNFGEGREGKRGGRHGEFGGHGKGGRHGLHPRLLDQLNLTDEQKTQVKNLHETGRADAEKYMETVRTADEQLRAMVEGNKFNESEARQIIGTKSAAMTELEIGRMKTDAAIFNLLSDEQKAKLEQLKAQRPPRGERMREDAPAQ